MSEGKRVTLHFWVRTDLIVGGRMQSPAGYQGLPPRVGARGLALDPAPPPTPAQTIARFLLAAWVGGGNVDFCIEQIDADGLARVRLTLYERDVDTVKFSVSFNMVVPKGQRNCHLASSDMCVRELGMVLAGSPTAPPGGRAPVFSDGQCCFSMRDNFTKNGAVLRFQNIDTDLAGLGALGLRPSALRALDRTNAAVFGLGQRLKSGIAHFAVSPLNAGPQYLDAFSYLQMQNCLVHYSLLGYAFDRLTSPVQLPWLMYDAFQAAHCGGVHPAALAGLSDLELVLRFGQPLVTAHTACGLSSIYCTDYTLNACDVACKLRETEDMAKTYGCLALQSQAGLEAGARGPGRAYAPSPAQIGAGLRDCPVESGLEACVATVREAQRLRRERGLANRVSFSVHNDDCENSAQSIVMKANAVRDLYRAFEGGGDGAIGRVADAMGRVAATAPWSRLFRNLSRGDHELVAGALLRLGAMLDRGDWATAFTVVSAKGPSYTEECPDAPGALSGHGTVVSRVRSGGQVFHGPLEGTTCMCQDPPTPAGAAGGFRVRLEDGTLASFDDSEFATVFGQNIHRALGVSADNCIAAHLRSSYGDTPQLCPFYVSAFYTGLSEGKGTLGCVPLDTKPPPSFGLGSKTLFGAPVMGLSQPTTVAVPVGPAMLSDDPREQEALLALMEGQMQEAYCPEASQETIATIASYWQPVSPLRGPAGGPPREGFAWAVRSLNTWAFDDPAHTTAAVRLYTALARRFNALQAKDPRSDRITASAFGHYLSAGLRFDIPMQPAGAGVLTLTAFVNLRQAAADVGFQPLLECPLKVGAVQARASVRTDAHFYMCDRGGGPVHAHRARFGCRR